MAYVRWRDTATGAEYLLRRNDRTGRFTWTVEEHSDKPTDDDAMLPLLRELTRDTRYLSGLPGGFPAWTGIMRLLPPSWETIASTFDDEHVEGRVY